MSAKVEIKDGQGTKIQACVKPTGTLSPKEHALCINISGTSPGQSITTSDSAAGGQTDVFLTLESAPGEPDGVTRNAAVDGSSTAQVFSFQAIAAKDFIVTDVIIVGIDVSVKLSNWLGQNSELDNGCILTIKANNELLDSDPFKRTRDLGIYASLAGFDLLSEQAGDIAKCVRQYKPLIVLRAKDSFGTAPGSDDFVSWTVQDSHNGIEEVIISLRGFVVEPGSV